MSKLGDAKLIGGIGSILLLIPGVNIVGYILILIAAKFISDELADKSIFNDMIYAVVAGIVGAVAAAFIILSGLIFGILTLGASAVVGVVVGLAVAWIFLIISAIFIQKAYGKISSRLGVGYFGTAGKLYFFGAVLVIILVGFILLFIAEIFQIIAFFSIPDVVPGMGAMGMAAAPTQPMAAPAMQPAGKFCQSCGAPLAADATFCAKCGAKQPG